MLNLSCRTSVLTSLKSFVHVCCPHIHTSGKGQCMQIWLIICNVLIEIFKSYHKHYWDFWILFCDGNYFHLMCYQTCGLLSLWQVSINNGNLPRLKIFVTVLLELVQTFLMWYIYSHLYWHISCSWNFHI